MAQAAMPASPFISTALYIRLSVEDNNKRGNSIETQKLVLEKFLLGKPELRLYDIYIDNGATGTNFNRDGFQRVFMTFISTMEQQERILTVTASNGCFRILNPAKWAV